MCILNFQINTFQALLVTDGRHSFVVFNYLDDGISWTRGDASQVDAQVGFNFGEETLRSYSFPTSRTPAIANIEEDSNTGSPGQYVYRVDSTVIRNVRSSHCDDLPSEYACIIPYGFRKPILILMLYVHLSNFTLCLVWNIYYTSLQ